MAVIRSQALARSRGDFSLAPCAVAMQHRFSAASLYLLEQAHGCSGPVQHRPHAVAEGPVAGRPGASAIWVRRVMRFFRQITPAMRRDCVRLCLGPCSTSTRAGERYHSVPTALLDRWKTWFGSWYGSGMTAFSGLKATPFRQQHGSLSVRTRSPRVPLFIAPHVPRTAPGSRPVCHTAVQAPRRCGSGELYPVCALHFSVVHVARD